MATAATPDLTFRLTAGRSVFGTLCLLALPALAEQALHLCVGLSDTLLTARVVPNGSEAHLAAVTSMGYLLWLLTELFVFVGVGASAVVARHVGAGDAPGARRAANQAFLLGMIGAVLVTIALLPLERQLAGMLRLEGRSADLALVYLRWVLPTLPFIMLSTVTVAILRGAGDARAALWILGTVNLVNVSVSWAATVGWGPFPAMGWSGIACGTAVAQVCGGLLGLLFLLRGRGGLRLNRADLVPDRTMQARILRVGIPGGLDILCVILCQIWFLGIVNGLGDTASAAHGLAIRVESLAFMPATAFQLAAASMVGQFLGARDPARARLAVRYALAFCLSIVLAAALAFRFGGALLAELFIGSDKPAVTALTGELLQIVAYAMPSLACMMVLNAALRGAGDTRVPLWINFTGFVGVRIPLAYLFTGFFAWGAPGAWYAMLIDLLFRSTLTIRRYLEGSWTRTQV